MELITNIRLALNELNYGSILLQTSAKMKTILYRNQAGIRIVSEHSKYIIAEEDFLFLFDQETFMIWEPQQDDSELAKLRDEEYYQWKHK